MGHKCHTGQSFIQFLWGKHWVHNQNICLLHWVCRLIRKYKLLFSFKAVTPCGINKCDIMPEVKPPPPSPGISRVGNLIMVK